MGSKTYYMKNAVGVVECLITDDDPDAKLKMTATLPFPSGYKPDRNITAELNDELGSGFLQLIGILCWAIELGWLDVFVEVSQLSQHQALPQHGHLEALYHIFTYLKKHENGAPTVFDPKTPILMHVYSIQVPTGETFMGTLRRKCHQICQNRKVKV